MWRLARRVERSTFENVAVRLITADTHSDHDTIGDRRKNREMPALDDPLQNGAAILFGSVEDEVRHAASA